MSYRGRSCEISWVPTHSIPEADQSNKLCSFGTSELLLSGEMDEHKHSGGLKMICHDFVTNASNVNYLTIQNVSGRCGARQRILCRRDSTPEATSKGFDVFNKLNQLGGGTALRDAFSESDRCQNFVCRLFSRSHAVGDANAAEGVARQG